MARASILKLPCEIHLLIFENMSDDLNTLAALESTCRHFHNIFDEHKMKFLNAALLEKKLIPEDLMTEAVLVRKVPANTPEKIVAAGKGEAMTSLLRRFQAMGEVDATVKLTDVSMCEALSMARYHSDTIEPLADYYIRVCCSQMGSWGLEFSSREPTSMESLRLQRALYRFELYLRALAGSDEHRAMRSYFFKYLDPEKNPQDVDQLIALQLFFQHTVRQAFNTVAKQLRQRARRDAHKGTDFLLMMGLRWSSLFVIIGVCRWPEELVQRQRHKLLLPILKYQRKGKIQLASHEDNGGTVEQAFCPEEVDQDRVPYTEDMDGSSRAWSQALESEPDRQSLYLRRYWGVPNFVEQLHTWGCVFWSKDNVKREIIHKGTGWPKWPENEIAVDHRMLAHRTRFLKFINPKILVQGNWD